MAFDSPVRGQEWRNSARPELPLWTTSFDHTHSQIPKAELPQTLPHSDRTTLKYTSLDSGSAYEPPPSPPDSLKAAAHRVLQDLRPAVHPRLYSVAPNRQTHQAPI
ncbi:uncharacterized protein N7479_001619 [Penicillium vulpinum]|uniref:Uncharacterized protein n=1 Tax=Penicillium vulpinum TaxID=29845 RepID=A0A1V6RUT2_9EURO|nr:uncharacterized protein N7479_001619 [Penicillium vulpinum]KAJ5971701.1 hypothetical protein N7479_001619 [Penicillium vulpinum]OQE05532.1 hypothetical protein PENVUL_c024G01795 [Penicillium vulpinum]